MQRATRPAAWRLASVAALAALVLAAGPARAQVDLDAWVERDRFETVKISPDGRHFAATVPMDDKTVLVVLDRASRKIVSGGAGVADSAVLDFWWAGDEQVVIAMGQSFGSKDPLYATGEVHVLELDGRQVRRLVGRAPDAGIVQHVVSAPREYATVIDPRIDEPDVILIATELPGPEPRAQLERLNLRSGRRATVTSAPVRRADFIPDPSGVARFADGLDTENYGLLYYRDGADAPWRMVNNSKDSGFIAHALGMAADGVTAYVQVTTRDGPDAIEAWDMRSLARTVLLRDPVADPDDVIYDADGRTPVGARYTDDGVRLRFFDEASPMARRYRMLERAFPGAGLAITSMTADGRLALVHTHSDRDPGQYLLFDAEAKTASGVFARMDWLAPGQIAATRKIQLKARDGLELHGYLTRPQGAAAGLLPLVVLVHGGPIDRHDSWYFDTDTQVLAAAGYAVLRLNFRGSGNYGIRYRNLGAQEWGGEMQDDLTDATRWAIDEGIADPERICIAGASYGGYAALMGVAKEPDLYRCAVGYVGVYDLPAWRADRARTANWLRNWANDWMGERDTLAARSPVNLAERIKVPVFLAAGGADTVAPLSQSKRMQRALEAAGVPVQTLYIDSEGHGFRREEHQRRYYAQLLAFLAEHLGGRTAR
ncbi:MAG TPA: S9 family peptidase [Luteimonas sp.]|nr:S9 family peptidase [Luteimonas sp.]